VVLSMNHTRNWDDSPLAGLVWATTDAVTELHAHCRGRRAYAHTTRSDARLNIEETLFFRLMWGRYPRKDKS